MRSSETEGSVERRINRLQRKFGVQKVHSASLVSGKLLIINGLAPQVGLEPTTLRLTVAVASFTAGGCDCLRSVETPCL
jgi:hypothetical protein